MHTIHISTNVRTNMARILAKFLKERAQLDIKHLLANQAVSAMLGLNEHSLAAAIRAPGGVELRIDGNTPTNGPPRDGDGIMEMMKGVAVHLRALESRLGQLLASPLIRFDEGCRRNLPEQPGVYRIFDLGRPDETVRAGRSDATLRQRVYQNHLMGNQAGNLPAQLVKSGVAADLSAAKRFMRESLGVQVLTIADERERTSAEHFILAVLRPRYSDRSQGGTS